MKFFIGSYQRCNEAADRILDGMDLIRDSCSESSSENIESEDSCSGDEGHNEMSYSKICKLNDVEPKSPKKKKTSKLIQIEMIS